MSAATVLARARAAALARMGDTCTITRGGTVTTDPLTGVVSTTGATTVYSGVCRFKAGGGVRGASASRIEVGQDTVVLSPDQVHLPVDTSTDVRAGDAVVCTTSATDPDLPGRRFTVFDPARGADLSARRVGIREAG